MKKKSIKVDALKSRVNISLADETLSQATKQELCLLLESFLFETGQYRGYNFIGWVNGGCEQWRIDGMPNDNSPYLGGEYSRVYY